MEPELMRAAIMFWSTFSPISGTSSCAMFSPILASPPEYVAASRAAAVDVSIVVPSWGGNRNPEF